MTIKSLPKLLFSIVLCEGAGLVGSLFTFSAISNWYVTLNKPSFSPPNYLFGPVWITLYALMGVSLYLIWQENIKKKEVKESLQAFGIHLFFNATWSMMFFGLRNSLLGLINILILWILIVIVIYKFYKINKTSGLLLLPYLVWVSFATYLNYSVWVLNR